MKKILVTIGAVTAMFAAAAVNSPQAKADDDDEGCNAQRVVIMRGGPGALAPVPPTPPVPPVPGVAPVPPAPPGAHWRQERVVVVGPGHRRVLHLDDDDDGRVTKREFMEPVERAFDDLDDDHDGVLTEDERDDDDDFPAPPPPLRHRR